MTEAQIYDGFIVNGTTDFQFVVDTLRRHDAAWCVIGGLAVNTYTSPVYTADLDLVVVAAQLEPVLADLRDADFRVQEFEFSIHAMRRAPAGGHAASMLMVQFSKVARYQPFVGRAESRTIFGVDVPVAALPDLVQGKLAAWSDPRRRPTKQLKDKLDLLRLAESWPDEVESLLPDELRAEAVANRQRNTKAGDTRWGGD